MLPHFSSLISDPVRGQIKQRFEELKALHKCKMVSLKKVELMYLFGLIIFLGRGRVESGSLNQTWWVSINPCLVSTGGTLRLAHFHYIETLFTTRKTPGILKLTSLWLITPCLSEAHLIMRDRIESVPLMTSFPRRTSGRKEEYIVIWECKFVFLKRLRTSKIYQPGFLVVNNRNYLKVILLILSSEKEFNETILGSSKNQ